MTTLRNRWRQFWAAPDPFLLRTSAVILACLGAVFLLVLGGVRGYMLLKKEMYHRRIAAELKAGNDENAFFYIRTALNQFPDDVEVTRMLVGLGERQGAFWTLEWKKRLHDLTPSDTSLALELATQAAQNNQIPTARRLAEKLLQAPDKAASAENLLAICDLKEGKITEALAHVEKAYRANPDSFAILNNYLAILLATNPSANEDKISALLGKLDQKPGTHTLAEQFRLALAMQQKRLPEALAIAERLAAAPGHTLSDQLQYISVMALSDPKRAEALLDKLRLDPGLPENNRLLLMRWMFDNRHYGKTIDLIKTLPEPTRQLPAVRICQTECQIRIKQLAEASDRLQKENWADQECLRIAYLSDIRFLQGKSDEAVRLRQAAVDAASDSPLHTTFLLDFTNSRKEWGAQKEALLWRLADNMAAADAALARLSRLYRDRGDAQGLLQVSLRQTKLHPQNALCMGNAVSLSLLTGNNSNWAHRQAAKLFNQYPANSHIRATYAYSLLLNERAKEALEIMQQIDPQSLHGKDLAFGYGLILMQNGRADEARQVWAVLNPHELLAPERDLMIKYQTGAK